MPEREMSCPYGDSDIDERYLAGTLSAEESEAFEEHYFGCDRCFAAVERGNEIRAALSPAAGARSSASIDGVAPINLGMRRFARWRPALAAAAVVVVALGIRQARSLREPAAISVASPTDAARGAVHALNLTSHATSAVLVAAWPAQPSAQSYRVRLLAADGSLLFEREIPDTSVILSRELLRATGTNPVYWEVQALDALRYVVATSPVVQAQTSPNPP
jgi:anti-sigma factor RsiW